MITIPFQCFTATFIASFWHFAELAELRCELPLTHFLEEEAEAWRSQELVTI